MKTSTTIIAGLMTLGRQLLLPRRPVLTVYTYDSFTAEWGPGPVIEAAFEESCGCDLQFVAAGDGAALLARLQLERERTEADIVLGLDGNLAEAARADGPVRRTRDRRRSSICRSPGTIRCSCPMIGAGSPLSRLSRCPGARRPSAELASSDLTVVIQDPRSSTPGLGLVMWIKAAYGDEAAGIWDGLSGQYPDGHAGLVGKPTGCSWKARRTRC